MDEIIVGIIVVGAIIFAIKNFISTYQGKKSCNCSSGGSCVSKRTCPSDFPVTNKK
ncbi:hypothetical protein [Desulfobacula sp.]|jgi:hypothetical protein|uniref:hypothetical protein n=1 Tax=Desulfobacula sp. TaxID=2593537 RepID=UPI001DCE7560|nr:FeoB-associated Cys-rich membrane protein [Desulfobacula sp.]MBT4027517.1 FeoB-associated Cys-rich membrane protein [Desulfobacula sp.]MBT4200952.1 FeoB-associated Cys-rich membrane protein [Desulfobacula sp.]MBT4508688.1 FeoB-associated Cys-rich membrane protein [Desulfobacula sp.]MBT6752007.1 FeoB-associated Cys-rich membrane protein [Desulfobacula sp.]